MRFSSADNSLNRHVSQILDSDDNDLNNKLSWKTYRKKVWSAVLYIIRFRLIVLTDSRVHFYDKQNVLSDSPL